MTDTDDRYAELEAALAPIRAAHPGITMQEAAPMLSGPLAEQMWARAVGRYLDERLAEMDDQPEPKLIETVSTTSLL